MKCPNCGQWNRASIPTCQRCGTTLPLRASNEPSWRGTLKDNAKQTQYIRMDMEGNPQDNPDARDTLAREMSELKVRKAAGREYQNRMRSEALERTSGAVPYTVRERTAHDRFWQAADSVRQDDAQSAAAIDEPVITAPVSKGDLDFDPNWNTEEFSATWALPPLQPTGKFTVKIPSRRRGLRRFIGFLTAVLIIGLIGIAGYFGCQIYKNQKLESHKKAAAEVNATMHNELAAHTILIPGEDGQQIYIRQLHANYIVAGGFATVEVQDHVWYDDYQDYLDSTMQVTLTPFLKTTSGQQKPLQVIHYDIDIPSSPIELLSPDTNREEVSASMYTMRFAVRPGSKVTINGKDYSDTVDSEDGTLSYNATLQPIGDNVFNVVVRSQYCRESEMTVVLYRQVQEVPLDLAADTYTSTSSQRMQVNCTTVPGAMVEVLSPHTDLDITNIDTSGAFSFYAVFDHIGYNTITITSSVAGKATSEVNYKVYYLPPPDEYTVKAWGMDETNYTELLGNIEVRAKKTQVYVVKGIVAQVVSTKPQMVIVYTGDNGTSRPVLIENCTTKNKTWVEGQYYEFYADAYSTYGTMPWLCGRYSYAKTQPTK